MNSQQELLNAINSINDNKDRSFDTPAEVLRVENDTVWVHIDGGADETPVLKTINCEQGDTVQVRISNGNAFLVGNATAPPTDDTTANVAHFVAEQAEETAGQAEAKAIQAIETAEALVVTVAGKVDSGDSNITDLSSTIYQNANGVNIYNDSLAVGDSYAHIDEDEFCIREVTSAGVIDDTNDPVLASFGKTETELKCEDQFVKLTTSSITLGDTSNILGNPEGWQITRAQIEHIGDVYSGEKITLNSDYGIIRLEHSNPGISPGKAELSVGGAVFGKSVTGAYSIVKKTTIDGCNITCYDETTGSLSGDETVINGDSIEMTGDVYSLEYSNGGFSRGYKKTPTVLTSTTISSSTTSYTFSDSSITTDSVIDVYDSIFGFAPTNVSVSTGSCTVTFPAQSSSHQIKLFVY